MKPRILFLNRSYWPDAEATGQLLTDLTEDLADRFDVHVLAGRPNHIAGADGEFAEVQHRNGVTIHRTRHSQFSKASKVGKLANLLSFTASAYWQLRRRFAPDLVVAQTDPFFLPLIARRMQQHSGCKMVVTLQDIYPDVMVGVGLLREGRTTRTIRKLLQRTYQHADRIVVLSRDMREKCRSWDLPDEKLTIIPNWADTNQVRPEKTRNRFRARHGLDDKFVVMYSGNLGYAHLLEPLLHAAARVQTRPQIQFVMIGEGVQKARLERMAGELGLTNVRFLPYQARDELSQSLSAADVHFVSMHPRVADCLMPSKLYGILASGTPIVAACPATSELADIIQDFDIGAVCDTGEQRRVVDDHRLGCELADAISHLADNPSTAAQMGASARLLAVEKYDRRIQTDLFAEMLDDVLAGETESVTVPATVSLDAYDTHIEPPRHGNGPRLTRPDSSLSDPYLSVPR